MHVDTFFSNDSHFFLIWHCFKKHFVNFLKLTEAEGAIGKKESKSKRKYIEKKEMKSEKKKVNRKERKANRKFFFLDLNLFFFTLSFIRTR